MKLTNVGEFNSITPFVEDKLNKFSSAEKNFLSLFSFMFSERENVMAEISNGFSVKKLTYGECADKIEWLIGALNASLSGVEKGAVVGLYMTNSPEWIQMFWALIFCGYSPLLINARLNDKVIEDTLTDYGILAVVSDGKKFNKPTFFTGDIFSFNGERVYPDCECGKEILFMSSGTSGNLKLCAYTAENFYYQVCDSLNIIKTCPQMKEHYMGELKILALLPFYHVFGFIAVYLWFGFFSRTFVFLKDLNPQTLLSSVKKHRVTHIFAVPLVWDTVYKQAVKTIKAKGEKTYNKFVKALKLSNKNGIIGKIVRKKGLKEVRDKLFGDSIKFLISGGSGVSKDTLEFFNGIGYHMANGYGMTEIGITSVEQALSGKVLNKGAIGLPFGNTQYKISDGGELLVKSKTRCARIMQGDKVTKTNYSEWFNTNDLALTLDGRYYVNGRKDDLIVCHSGENINPEIIEKSLTIDGVNSTCLFADENKIPTLMLSVDGHLGKDALEKIRNSAIVALSNAKVGEEVKKIVLTSDKLLGDGEFKKSRKKISKRYSQGEFNIIDTDKEDFDQRVFDAIYKEVAECFAKALGIDCNKILANDDFFMDLGGTSLDYFTLLGIIQSKFDVDDETLQEWSKTTVSGFAEELKKL